MTEVTVLCEGCITPLTINVEDGEYPWHLAKAWCRAPECVAKRIKEARNA